MPTELTKPVEDELEQVSARGRAIYDGKLKPILEPEHNGEVVAIHVDSGDYEVAGNSPTARFTLRKRQPQGMIMVTDIGPAKLDTLTSRMIASQFLSGQNK